MESVAIGTWAALLALGAFHGVNPGMGWLFAVARGMQEKRRAEVWRALLPLGVGHAAAVGAAVVAAAAIGRALPVEALKWGVAAFLVALGARRLVRHRHPRSRGMRVGMAGLTVWSFLMASAHGAGLMVVPLVLDRAAPATARGAGAPGGAAAAAGHAGHAAALGVADPATALALAGVHALGYLAVSALIAAVVYEKVGLRFLRTRWFNLDLVWAVALIATGVLTALV
ncbi:MAG TPA: hypothetical protein VM778_03725 [Gemmatimonadota bacterium]|nr:hypothetical protein [Gemmatimonadota bacterium]